ncbi:reverse transcriptase [Senna tora]|uniref:Reverse transcriptase n=1 Tax=Senna tora TaxID=362788 RepID=A0A835CEJ7_9FABA|nr:reverse transcriptase [Senna tora]
MRTPEVVKQARQKRLGLEARLQANLAGQKMRDLMEEEEQRSKEQDSDRGLIVASEPELATVSKGRDLKEAPKKKERNQACLPTKKTNEKWSDIVEREEEARRTDDSYMQVNKGQSGGKLAEEGAGVTSNRKGEDLEPHINLVPSNTAMEISVDQGNRENFYFGSLLSVPQNINVIKLPTNKGTQATPKDQHLESPSILLSSEEISQAHSQWASSIIVRLMGCFIDQASLTNKLMSIWNLRAQPNIINLGLGFFIVRFGSIEDRWSALLHGPTLINGHLLAIDLWKQGFSLSSVKRFSSSPVWIKLEGLPIELFAPNILIRIGNSIGKFIGIDGNTHNMSIAKHARICVLLDLSNATPSHISIGNFIQPIIIEGTSNICLACGGGNHAQAACKGKRPFPPSPSQPPTKDDDWQVVSRRKSEKGEKASQPLSQEHTKEKYHGSEKVSKRKGISFPKKSRDSTALQQKKQNWQISATKEKGQGADASKEGSKVGQIHEFHGKSSGKEPCLKPSEAANKVSLSQVSQEKRIVKSAPRGKESLNPSSHNPSFSPNEDKPFSQNAAPPEHTPSIEALGVKSAKIPNLILNVSQIKNSLLASSSSSSLFSYQNQQNQQNVTLHPTQNSTKDFTINTTTMTLPNTHPNPSSEPFLENQLLSQNSKATSTIASKPKGGDTEKSKPEAKDGTEAKNPVPYHWRIWENLTTALTSQTTWFQAWARLMLESQLLQVREHAVKELMNQLQDNGQALLFPPAIIQTSPAMVDPPMNSDLFNSNQLLQVFNMDLSTVLNTYQGNLAQGVLLYTSNSVQTVDAIVTSSLLPETGSLEYHLKFSPTPSLRYTGKFYMDDSPHSDHYINPKIEESVGSVGHDEVEIDNNMTPINILAWNARGAASAEFRRVIMDLKTRHLPRVMFITETRVGGIRAENIIKSIGYDGYFKVDPMGYAGGLWLLWDSAYVKMTIHGDSFQEIQATIEVSNFCFLVSFIYDSPIRERRKILWSNLRNLADIHSLPWLMCGVFNEILAQDEKMGGLPASLSRIRDFKQCMEYCGVTNLGFTGQKFTSLNKREDGQVVFERLDRFLANPQWIHFFLHAINHHLPRIKSDHTPILLSTIPNTPIVGQRPFRCERIWLGQKDFQVLVKNNWSRATSIDEGLALIREQAKLWNKNVFGNIFLRKNRLIKRLNGINVALQNRHNPGLIKLEQELSSEYQDILRIEEELWASKSRVEWLQLGDSNTSFFHSNVIVRRCSNRILGLQSQNGKWLYDPIRRRANDNVIIANEVIHSYNRKRSRKHRWMMISLDLEKASVSHQVLINGTLSDRFIPSRGIRQGDPLSPFIFIYCMQYLSALIEDQVGKKNWMAPKLRNTPISHLLFADDVLLFARIDDRSISAIKHTLDSFLACSGLSINSSKSSIWFSNNTPVNMRNKTTSVLNFSVADKPGKYLGAALGVKGKHADFIPLINKIQSRLDNWSNEFLSLAGKTTLINSVISPIISFHTNSMVLPAKTSKSIDKSVRNFFWSSAGNRKKIHTINWAKVCTPSSSGGLGIHLSKERNIALISKLAWQVNSNPKPLWAHVTKHYLRPSCNSFSVTGRALKRGFALVESNSSVYIGNGKNTKVWEDNWFGKNSLRKLLVGPLNKHEDRLTVNRLANDWGSWTWDNLSFDLPQNIKDLISAAPCFKDSLIEDSSCCLFQKNGSFLLNNLYVDLFSKPHPNIRISNCGKWIWRSNCHYRLKFFLWLCVNNGLPTKVNLIKRRIHIDASCPFCNSDEETASHLFKECSFSQTIWQLTKCNLKAQNVEDLTSWVRENCINTSVDTLGVAHNTLFIYTLWQIWLARNEHIFNTKSLLLLVIAKKSMAAAAEYYHLANDGPSDAINFSTLNVNWFPPLEGWWKLNTDGACSGNPGPFAIGGIIRNQDGNWISGFSGYIGFGSALKAELWAISNGIRLAKNLGCSHLWI